VAAVIAGGVAVAMHLVNGPLAAGRESANEQHRLGYQCAQSVWVETENDPNAQAEPTGQFQSMFGSCRAEARVLHVSFAPASPFRSGFMAGFGNPR
jgi:hypothetical protein